MALLGTQEILIVVILFIFINYWRLSKITTFDLVGIQEIFVAVLAFIFIHYWRLKNNTTYITKWPFFGMLPGILLNLSNIHEYSNSLLKHHGGNFNFEGPWLTNINYFVTSDAKNVQHITSTKFENYGKGKEFLEIFDILGDGIFNSDSHAWKYSRAMLHSIFKQGRFQLFIRETIMKKLDSCMLPFLDQAWKEGIELDLQDAFQRLTFDNICSIVLGYDPNCLSFDFPQIDSEKAFSEAEDAIFHRHIMPRCIWKLQKWLQVGTENKLIKGQKTIDQLLYDEIKSKRSRRMQCRKSSSSNSSSSCIVDDSQFNVLNALMNEEGETGQIDDKFLRDTGMNLLAAGRDTISSCLSWFFWLVATHPLVEAKILEEIKENLPKGEDNLKGLCAQGLNKLVYLHGAICETLRLYPPVPFEHKCALKSDVLPSGHRVNSNTVVVYSLYSMGRMEKLWGEDCMKFRPERWISSRGGIIHVPSYKFIAFNAGPRACLGKDISFTELKMVAVAILWNYHINVVENHVISPSVSVVLHMKHGLKVKVTKRCV